MLDIQQNIALKHANTLAITANARYYIDIQHEEQVPHAMAYAKQQQLPVLVLGGGSNIVFTQDFHGLVIKMSLKGVTVVASDTDNDELCVTALAGENWHDLVQLCLAKGYHGLENLSLIPGTVGAAPIQNIGAYGVEIKQRFHSLRGWDCDNACWKTFNTADCQFGYRDSIFKHQLKDKFIITSVSFTLNTKATIDIVYDGLRAALKKNGLSVESNIISPKQVADTVIAIRQSKLPDPKQLPNAGSFFKNPTLSQQEFAVLKRTHPAMINYPQVDGSVKLAAGWILEQAGWKGKTLGSVGMHEAQSLVLINTGAATGAEVISFATQVQADIKHRFGVSLEIEPSIY